ncbi:SulP family inorganic anion transporter [Nocardioides sp. NPDC047086]|uniref:SulP family inorganic anion transporter n=1 Tax=Nocardioides sp. NPDC047086 TaxID=3154810 RepID=UPI0033FA8BAC
MLTWLRERMSLPRHLFDRRTARRDAAAGAVLGIESVPDGLASGLLAGVNPVAGLYGYLFGLAGGALFTGTAAMAIQGTGAMAIIVADVDLDANDDPVPVGGSMSATSLVVGAGARNRFALLVAAVVMAAVIVLFAGVVELVAMPALAGLLIVVGVGTVKPAKVLAVARTEPVPLTVTTLVLTLLMPLQYAVLVGLGLSALLFVIGQSSRLVTRRLVMGADDRVRLPGHHGDLGGHPGGLRGCRRVGGAGRGAHEPGTALRHQQASRPARGRLATGPDGPLDRGFAESAMPKMIRSWSPEIGDPSRFYAVYLE